MLWEVASSICYGKLMLLLSLLFDASLLILQSPVNSTLDLVVKAADAGAVHTPQPAFLVVLVAFDIDHVGPLRRLGCTSWQPHRKHTNCKGRGGQGKERARQGTGRGRAGTEGAGKGRGGQRRVRLARGLYRLYPPPASLVLRLRRMPGTTRPRSGMCLLGLAAALRRKPQTLPGSPA